MQKIIEKDILEITPYPKNAKVHSEDQVKKVAASIEKFGFNQPIVVDEAGVIIVGHGRYEAAKMLGLSKVPVLIVPLNEEQASAYRLADNKLNESEWNMDLAFEELKKLTDEMFDLTGFSREEFEGRVGSDVIDELSKQRDIDLGKYMVLTVEAPEAPRLKARMSFYCDNIDDFNKLKEHFKKDGGELDTNKLLKLI